MNHYQDQTKKKPLIQYHKTKYNQPTIAIKQKIKKDKSAEKQNMYDHASKKFKDYNLFKFQPQSYTNQNNFETFMKQNPQRQMIPLAPSNIQMNNHSSYNTVNKNLTFGTLKNNQKSNQTFGITQNQPNSHIISVNVNIQNVSTATNPILQTKKNMNKYDVRPLNLKRNTQNQKSFYQNQKQVNANQKNIYPTQNYRPMFLVQKPKMDEKSLKIDQKSFRMEDQKRKNTTTQRLIQRASFLDRNNNERNIERNDKNQKKQKFKKQIQQKYMMSTSPYVDKQFLCEEQLEIKTINAQKRPLLYEKKLSQKKLSGIPISHQIQNQAYSTNVILNQPLSNINGTGLNTNAVVLNGNGISVNPNARYNTKKLDKKAMDLKDLKQFQLQQSQINTEQCFHQINVVFNQQQKYMVDSTYLDKNQKSINWTVRAILIDWMRQLSHQYSLKRDTYHLAVVLLDNFLAKKANIQKQIIQTIGTTTLFIASKLEQLQCKPSEQFAQATQGICTAKDIQNWEIEICKTLQFNLNPPTISSLANRIMQQWDKYIDQVDYAMHHLCFEGKQKVYFKKLDQSSYKFFRQLNQFIDCTILDIQTTQYKPILIVLSLMYLIIGVKVSDFQYEQIHQVFPRSSQYLLDRSNYFNDLFQNFVQSSFGLTLIELLPSIQYTASFFNLNLTYQKPLIQESQDQLQSMNLQEYCSYQTYNRHMLKTVTNRFRGIMNVYDH